MFLNALYSTPFLIIFFTGWVYPMASFNSTSPIVNCVNAVRRLSLNRLDLSDYSHLWNIFKLSITKQGKILHAWPTSISSITHSASVWAWVAFISCAAVRGRSEWEASVLYSTWVGSLIIFLALSPSHLQDYHWRWTGNHPVNNHHHRRHH